MSPESILIAKSVSTLKGTAEIQLLWIHPDTRKTTKIVSGFRLIFLNPCLLWPGRINWIDSKCVNYLTKAKGSSAVWSVEGKWKNCQKLHLGSGHPLFLTWPLFTTFAFCSLRWLTLELERVNRCWCAKEKGKRSLCNFCFVPVSLSFSLSCMLLSQHNCSIVLFLNT